MIKQTERQQGPCTGVIVPTMGAGVIVPTMGFSFPPVVDRELLKDFMQDSDILYGCPDISVG